MLLRLMLVAAVVGAAAGPSTAEPPPKSTPERLSQRLCGALQALPEARKAQCCGASPTGGLAPECARRLAASLRSKALTVDPDEIARCEADASRQLDGCDWVTPWLPRTPASCGAILRGQLAAGASCRSSLECRDGLFCRGEGPTTPGVCAPPGGPGSTCAGAPDALVTYTRQTDADARHPECAGFCFKGRCVGAVPPGGECSSDRRCATGSHCASGRCVGGPRPRLGEPCEGTTCAGALACIAGRCAPPKKAGERCTEPFECEATCLSRTAETPGTCGMKCSAWPPAGYTAPVTAPPADRQHAAILK